MAKPTFLDFVAFVKERPADRKIDHSGGWQECAVGDFIARVHRKGRQSPKHGDMCWRFKSDEIPSDINYVLSNGYRVEKQIGPNNTYGELADWLTEQGY